MFDLSMSGYIQAALHGFQHSPPSRKEHALHSWKRTSYGATYQFTKAKDTSQKKSPERIMILQKITGLLLFYAKVIYLTILVALGKIAAEQTSGKIETEK